MKTKQQILSLALLLMGSLFTQPALALSTDSEQPMNIQADRVDIDDEKGTSIFHGNVVITRGSIRITGNKVTVYRDKQKNLDKIHAVGQKGKPAHFQQRPDNKPDDVIAEAINLRYNASTEILDLKQSAKAVQGGSVTTGDHIVYKSKTDTVIAKSKPGASKNNGGRVNITIQPKKNKKTKK